MQGILRNGAALRNSLRCVELKREALNFLGCPEDLYRADLRPQTIALGHSFGLIPRLPSARDIPPPNSWEW